MLIAVTADLILIKGSFQGKSFSRISVKFFKTQGHLTEEKDVSKCCHFLEHQLCFQEEGVELFIEMLKVKELQTCQPSKSEV